MDSNIQDTNRVQLPTPAPKFSDDERLPAAKPNQTLRTTILPKVHITAIPESPAVVASDSISNFRLLLRLRGSSLSEYPRHLKRAPIDLVMVLDSNECSHKGKMVDVKRTALFVIHSLGHKDRLSIVVHSFCASRVLRLRRMTKIGVRVAKKIVVSIKPEKGPSSVVEGLKMGVRVLEERQYKNPVASIILLSGEGTRNTDVHLPQEFEHRDRFEFPVHAFGIGPCHDPRILHSVCDASCGTYSFLESYSIAQHAVASCIGGLLSVVHQELRVTIMTASPGVQIKSISSGRFDSSISCEGRRGMITVVEVYADEVKDFLITLSIPKGTIRSRIQEKTMQLLDIICFYKDALSQEMVLQQCTRLEVLRPTAAGIHDSAECLEVNRERTRRYAAESIAEAQRMAETRVSDANNYLSNKIRHVFGMTCVREGDELSRWVLREMVEIKDQMESWWLYEMNGRAYTLSNMIAHGCQRATSIGNRVPGGYRDFERGLEGFDAYATPNMAYKVRESIKWECEDNLDQE